MTTLKGMKINSPRGPITIDPAIREVIQAGYVRKMEKVNGDVYNVAFDKLAEQTDPGKKPRQQKRESLLLSFAV